MITDIYLLSTTVLYYKNKTHFSCEQYKNNFKVSQFQSFTEPRHSPGALPECSVPWRQQAGDGGAEPGAVGRQEGMDQGWAGQPVEAHV